jgi:hypothetical protein
MNQTISIYQYPGQLDDVRELRAVCMAIGAARNKDKAAKEFENKARRGWSWKNLQTIWRAWENGGRDDALLLDCRMHRELKATPQGVGMPAEFLLWVGGLMAGNQRKSKAAHRDMLIAWQRWRETGTRAEGAFPGYDAPPWPADRQRIPAGWSYENLMAMAQPAVEELAIARIGTVAAKAYLPTIPGTREGIRFLEWIFCDDVKQDREIITPGYIDPMPLLQLGILDYASGVYLKFGMRPDLPREDGTRDRLKRRDFLFLVAHLILEYGWPADYIMHIVCERGTATMSLAEAQFLYEISSGHIRVGYTSMEGQFVLAWDESKSGNAQGKGPLESWHNLFHNESASLSGQVGKDRNHSPAALHGSRREVAALNKLALLLTPEQRRALKLPYSTFAQAHAETLAIVQRINRRTDHEMEGFEQVMEWKLRGVKMDWQPEAALLKLDPALRGSVEFLPRVETPIERMQRLSAGVEFIKPHPGAMVKFYEDSHVTAKIERKQVSVNIEKKTYVFGPDDPFDALPNGTPVNVHHDPLDPEQALITSEGKFIGVWRRQLARRNDPDSISKGIRRQQSFLNHAAAQVRGKMADRLIEQDNRLQHNREVLEEAGVLPSEASHALADRSQQEPNDFTKALAQASRVVKAGKAKQASIAQDAAEADDLLSQ